MTSSLVVDAHVHGTHYLPGWVAAGYRLATRPHPHDVGFGELRRLGIDAVVAKAVGDAIVTAWRWPRDPWDDVLHQLDDLRHDAEASGCRIVTTAGDLTGDDRPAVVLGLEGGDPLGHDPSRLETLHGRGVRVIGIVHYVHSRIGTVCTPWQEWLPIPLPRRRPARLGLTSVGGEIVDGMNRLGMLVDVAHADRTTTLAVCERTSAPVISSHTGAALQDFSRFISDDEVRAIAGTGGLIGLWPFHYRGEGVKDLDDFARHADHLATIAGGPEHLCIGTDQNAVSGLMAGYAGQEDFPKLLDALRATGFDDAEIAGIAGANWARVFGLAVG